MHLPASWSVQSVLRTCSQAPCNKEAGQQQASAKPESQIQAEASPWPTAGPPPRQPSSIVPSSVPRLSLVWAAAAAASTRPYSAEPQVRLEPLFNCCFWRVLGGLLVRALWWSWWSWLSQCSHDVLAMRTCRGRMLAISLIGPEFIKCSMLAFVFGVTGKSQGLS